MDVITMHSINWLISKLEKDFPEFKFCAASEFWWSADRKTVYIDPESQYCQEFCLHELSHAILDHRGYKADIDLIRLERDAWEYAKNKLAVTYKLTIDEEIIQDNLDTYREWLHERSKCPDCRTTGLQSGANRYRCIACGHAWRVNEARLCALRRYSSITK